MSEIFGRPVGSQSESPSVNVGEKRLIVNGYHNYSLVRIGGNMLLFNRNSTDKYRLAVPYFSELYAKGCRSVADIGCSSGLLSLYAANAGLSEGILVDHDPEYIDMAKAVTTFAGLSGYQATVCRASELGSVADVAVFLALIHWIYNATEELHSMEAIADLMRGVALKCLFVEWVEPWDAAVKTGSHLTHRGNVGTSNYDKDKFLNALRERFSFVFLAYRTTASREVWIASDLDIEDLSGLQARSSSLPVWDIPGTSASITYLRKLANSDFR